MNYMEAQSSIVTSEEVLSRVVTAALLSILSSPDFHMPPKRRLLSAKDILDQYGISKRTLEHWRKLGIGPEYTVVGGRIMYERVGFEKFIAAGCVRPVEVLPKKPRGRPRTTPASRQ